jgi:hypothetical protein
MGLVLTAIYAAHRIVLGQLTYRAHDQQEIIFLRGTSGVQARL